MHFILKFPEFKKRVIPFLKTAVVKSASDSKAEIVEIIQNINTLDAVTSDFLVLYYLPFYIPPAKQVQTNSRKSKPTISESQNFFTLLVAVSIHVIIYTLGVIDRIWKIF